MSEGGCQPEERIRSDNIRKNVGETPCLLRREADNTVVPSFKENGECEDVLVTL